MSYKTTDNTGSILGQTQQRASIFLRILAEFAVTTSSPGTPKDKGNLRQDVLKQINGLSGKIEWRKKYAAVQEKGNRGGIPFKNYTTPGTGPHFAENAINEAVSKTNVFAKQAGLI